MPDADPGSLERLHDIATAPPVPWWPPGPGWLVVAGVVLVLAATGVAVAVSRWRANRYRRDALALLAGLPREARSLPALAELLKRVALAAYPRDRVASLTGEPWLTFLDDTGPTAAFAHGPGRLVEAATFRDPATLRPTDAELAELWAATRTWIERHRC